ncbi:F-box/kelch-repeat protein SKIP6 [Eutrema salsugineum]|nr:F-box/kelch-repeat protein SKIP6 [Eutrema salsugineum]
MKGTSAIRGCRQSQLALTASQNETRKKKTRKVCGLWSLPDAVVLNCLAQVSRLDLAALAIASKSHRSLVVSPELWDLRSRMGFCERYLYVCLHILSEPNPRWFVLHPVQRRLKPIDSYMYQTPASSSFVEMDWGIYIIGGLVNGKPTSDVSLFDCFEHTWFRIPPMKMARASASASLIDDKIYVFGGCGDDADSSNWAEVYDLNTETWDFLSVSTPTLNNKTLNIQQSVVIDKKKEVYVLAEDGQSFSFSPSQCMFVASEKTDDSKPQDRADWCLIGTFIFCRGGTRGKILWCLPYELDWKEVKGLEELQEYDITKLCRDSTGKMVIFWNVNPQPEGPKSVELWSAEISLKKSKVSEASEEWEVWGYIDWSGKLIDTDNVKVLFAGSVFI